jgi:hypothetical protein
MNVEKVDINSLVMNPNNPRTIKDDKFKKLVKSIKDFPNMLELRPIVVDENLIVLGGNMRLKACKEAGLKEIWIVKVHLDERKKKEFVVKDNVNYGNWDYLLLEDTASLEDWGMDLPSWLVDNMEDEDDDFFTDDFYKPYIKPEEEQPETPITTSTTSTTYFLLMLENEDWEFVKKVEPTLQKQTGTDNISDAIYKIIME